MQTILFASGLALFLAGLLTGFAIPGLKNPRMGLTSHLEGVSNGVFLIVIGLLWPYVDVNRFWELVAIGLLLYGTVTNWFTTLLSGFWGAGRRNMPIAGGDHEGSTAQENIIFVLLVTLSLAMVVGTTIVLIGVLRG